VTGAPPEPALVARPANAAKWEDMQAVFGARGQAARCQCQRFRLPHRDWWHMPVAERAARQRADTCPSRPDAPRTTGLVGYLGAEPVGWCAVAPRPEFLYFLKSRVPWAGRAEDRADPGVWAVPCFVTRAGFRRRGISRAMARAAVDFARARGARALEGYPMVVAPGEDVPWGELHVGDRSIFRAAGFAEVARPTPRRAVMRIGFA
jgi:GNAT superfamily N-acetyltransferase